MLNPGDEQAICHDDDGDIMVRVQTTRSSISAHPVQYAVNVDDEDHPRVVELTPGKGADAPRRDGD